MNRLSSLFAIFIGLIYYEALGQTDSVTWSEIMFKPAISGDSSEFVEIHNFGSFPVDVINWRIRDNLALDTIKDAGFGTILQPGQYAVIFTKNYDIVNGLYISLVPPSALILKVHDNQIGNTLGNTIDSLRLINGTGDTVSRFSYNVSSSYTAGHSLEKILMSQSNTGNWLSALTLHGTPGATNSVSPKQFDLSVTHTDIVFTPALPLQNQPFDVSVKVRNRGSQAATNFQTIFYRITGSDSVLYDTQMITNLDPSDSVTVTATDTALTDDQRFRVKIIWSGDQDTANNTAFKEVLLSAERFRIVINEIMYAPSTGNSEWVEIYNRSGDTLNIKNWTFADASKITSPVTITAEDHILLPGDYVVLCQDTVLFNNQFGPVISRRLKVGSWPTLNNDLDMVVLIDSIGAVVDSLFYSASWGGSTGGKSVERKYADSSSVMSSNWGTSVALAGATPGTLNSLTETPFDAGIAAISFTPLFPEKDQVYTVKVTVKNFGTQTADTVGYRIVRRMRSDSVVLSQAYYYQLQDSVTLSVNDTARVSGQTIAAEIIFSHDQKLFNNTASKTLIFGAPKNSMVINEIMYSPATGNSEWVEIVNRSADTLDLKKWMIADEAAFSSGSFKTITTSAQTLLPGEFVILCDDSVKFKTQYPGVTARKLRPSSWPALNESEMIVLTDSLGKIVDSLFYENSWGGASDKSLERKDVNAASTVSSNWGTSVAVIGASPGAINSITPFDFDLSVSSADIGFSPAFPQAGDTILVRAVLRNAGLLTVRDSFKTILYYDENLDGTGSASERLDSARYDSLAVNDSIRYQYKWGFPAATVMKRVTKKYFASKDSLRLILVIDYPADQRLINNQAAKIIRIGTTPQALVINEVLYNPDTSQVEFVELYNRGTDTLNLKNWFIHDASAGTKKFISTTDLPFYPSMYLVLTADTTVYRKYPSLLPSEVIIVKSLAAFNADKDAVVIKDAIGAIVDSFYYYSSWGGSKGVSLERISVNRASNDPGNWGGSISVGGASPGKVNGILSARPAARNALVINEIMFAPFADEPEYIEFYNPADTAVNLANWSLQVGESKVILTTSSFEVPAREYAVISENKEMPSRYKSFTRLIKLNSMPSLSNTGATVMLRDLVGTVIDSVVYDPDWGGDNGLSLERIRPLINPNVGTNWGNCAFVEGGTPGVLNSLFTDDSQPDKIKISAEPNPFFVDQNEQTKITIELPVTQARLTLKIFDNQGRLIRTLLNNSPSGSYREVLWDGKDQKGHFARMGIYVMLLEAVNENPKFNKSAKKTVVLGRKL